MNMPRTVQITDKVFSHEHNEARKKAYEQSMPQISSIEKFVKESKFESPVEDLGNALDYIVDAIKQRDSFRGIESDIKISDIIFILDKYNEFKGRNLLG